VLPRGGVVIVCSQQHHHKPGSRFGQADRETPLGRGAGLGLAPPFLLLADKDEAAKFSELVTGVRFWRGGGKPELPRGPPSYCRSLVARSVNRLQYLDGQVRV
jgi:hypothetical protein